MRWQGRRKSSNVIDNRGRRGGGKVIGGGIGVLVIALVVHFLGGDPNQVLQQAGNMPTSQTTEPYTPTAEENELADFVSVVLAETEDFWHQEFQRNGYGAYNEPKLEIFRNETQSGCGGATKVTGPFYCPADQTIYIDLSFYDMLHRKFGAPGDFAMAYVVAHEVGHHVQTLLEISQKVRALQSRSSQKDANRLSVMQELQADFLAGMWARYADRMQGIVESGDIEEALNAANAIGDDRLQREHGSGRVVPDAFTHGTSAQRMRWFMKGYETGDINQGDTFGASEL